MGDCYEYCVISGLPIGGEEEVVSFLISPQDSERGNSEGFERWEALTLPVRYKSNDYTAISALSELEQTNIPPVWSVFSKYVTEDKYGNKSVLSKIDHSRKPFYNLVYEPRICTIRRDIWDFMISEMKKQRFNGWAKDMLDVIDGLHTFEFKPIGDGQDKWEKTLQFNSDLRDAFRGWFSPYFFDVYKDEIINHGEHRELFLVELEDMMYFNIACSYFQKKVFPNHHCPQDNWYHYLNDKYRVKMEACINQVIADKKAEIYN